MTIKLHNTMKDIWLGHHWETSAQCPNDHGKKERYRQKDQTFTGKIINKLIHL